MISVCNIFNWYANLNNWDANQNIHPGGPLMH
jgi:hypothetical protein